MNKLGIFKYLSWVLIVTSMALVINPIPTDAQFETPAASAMLMEATNGQILYEKNADKPLPPASITKLMTLYLGLEALENNDVSWDDLVPISEKAWRTGGSKMFLDVGDNVKYSDIMTGISVVSANDGCVALAEYLYGSEEAFVRVMNQRAEDIGLKNTLFKNSTGLPEDGHIMSALDIAVLARNLIQNYPRIFELESQREFTFNNILQLNRNPLLGVFPGADGLKTGWTNEAGFCLVGTAEQDGIRLISVVLNTKDNNERLSASQELLYYGFRNFEKSIVKKSNDIVDSIEVIDGKKNTVPIKVKTDISILVPKQVEHDIEITTLKSKPLEAPVSADTLAGKLEVKHNNQILASANIYTTEDVQRAGFVTLIFRRIGKFFRSLVKISK